jgi:acyl-coenzyme A thioesterase PaaI-like protein
MQLLTNFASDRQKLWSQNATVFRIFVNLWPCIFGGGGWITHISDDFTELDVQLRLSARTRNAVGTIFGGSMYASTDPFYMLMLMRILGSDFVVWDKGCTIRFKRPAKQTIHAKFRITPSMLESVMTEVKANGESTFVWQLDYKDKDGILYAEFDKVLYVATKSHYKEKLRQRSQGEKG